MKFAVKEEQSVPFSISGVYLIVEPVPAASILTVHLESILQSFKAVLALACQADCVLRAVELTIVVCFSLSDGSKGSKQSTAMSQAQWDNF